MITTCDRLLRTALFFCSTTIACCAEPEKPADRVPAAREFVKTLAKEDYAAAVKTFDETMTKVMPAEKLAEAWKSVVQQSGAFKARLGTRTAKIGKYDVVFVTCEFEKEKLDVRVVFDTEGRIAGLFFQSEKPKFEFKPPPYAEPDKYTERSVIVGEGGDWPLPGTLTLPKGDGPFPAIVLVHGSGSHDRDETIGPNKPFRDLAWGLAGQGIAVLRYEKRTLHHKARMPDVGEKLTIQEECIDDAVAAAKLLRKQKEIDGKRIYVAGHSLGAIVAPRIGELDPGLAGLILLSGSPRPFEDIVLEQMTYIFSLDGGPTDDQKKELEEIRKQVARVKDPKLTAETPAVDLPLRIPAPYWLALKRYDAAGTAARLAMPMLILQGERDYQVTMTDLEAWRKAVGGRTNVRFKSYPKLNHLYMDGEGKATPGEYGKAGHVSREVIDDIAAWIKKP